jgi:hypothetical protein
MIDTSKTPHHIVVDEVATLVSTQVRNGDIPFFRVLVAQALCVMASTMRTRIVTNHRGTIPVNGYTIALAPSGTGKGAAVSLLENVTKGFRRTFADHTMPLVAESNFWKLAIGRAARKGTEDQTEFDALVREYLEAGAFTYVFDEATKAAIRQARHKLLLANCGALNLQVDEIGTNLSQVLEALASYLELYDLGDLKRSLTKNTSDNKRVEEIEGRTPANFLGFGTPTKLLDGGKTEDEFYSLLETGYARRCFFAMGRPNMMDTMGPVEQYNMLCDPTRKQSLDKWSNHFATLADPTKLEWTIEVPDSVGVIMMTYQVECERAAKAISDHEPIRKAELTHRYWKAIKLAGALAFVEEELVMHEDHFLAAVKLVEESGEAFSSILRRERNYAKLARYLAGVEGEMTHADLTEVLPFYKSATRDRSEMITLATAWGYKNHVVIRKRFVDNIELFSGETLKETDLDQIPLAYSEDFAYHYEGDTAPFDQLHLLTQSQGMNFTTHQFKRGHRTGEAVIPGFNLIVLDLDGSVSLDTVHRLMKDYTFMTYTTKRHTPEVNRFRLIIPMSHELKLDKTEYQAFIQNFLKWLPFEVDDTDAACDQVRKWATFDGGTHHYNLSGSLVDVLPFIPQSTRNEQYRKEIAPLESLDNLERWFAQHMAQGDRNNQMIKFALALVDSGMNYANVEDKVLSFNKKLGENALAVDELQRTVLVTVAKKLQSAA